MEGHNDLDFGSGGELQMDSRKMIQMIPFNEGLVEVILREKMISVQMELHG